MWQDSRKDNKSPDKVKVLAHRLLFSLYVTLFCMIFIKTIVFIIVFFHSIYSHYFKASGNIPFPGDIAVNKFSALINDVFYQECSVSGYTVSLLAEAETDQDVKQKFQLTLDGQVTGIKSVF